MTRTSWALDPTTRTLHTEVDVANGDGLLRPGMYARVSIDLAEAQAACIVPTTAVVTAENRAWCFVVENGKAVRKPVTLGLTSGNEVEITSGLSGDELVIQGKGASLASGRAVELIEATPAK